MNRLTEKVKNMDDYIKLATKDKQEFINKLGKLEDLEEEIGINNLIAFLEWCVKFRNNFINSSFDDMVAFYKRAMCVTENKKE